MRIRKVTIITIIGLIITLILQIGGLFYAYRSNMEAMQLTVNKNFAIAFYETNDNLANQLPYPDGTTIAYIPTAPNSAMRRWFGTISSSRCRGSVSEPSDSLYNPGCGFGF